ncbi:MAG: DUF1638 domain-containing protein [Thermodesulfovibrionales bacterium]|jgi:hypothetical protein
MTKKNSVVCISCGIFRDELEYLVKEKGLDWDIVFLGAALHVNFDKLKARLIEALEKNRKPGTDLRVVYGSCHPEMSEILDRYGAKKIKAANCLEAMAGPNEIKRLNAEAKTFFLSAGWANNWEEMFAQGREDFDFDFKSMFGSYKRIIVFDMGVIPIDEEKVAKFSQFTGLPVERRQITLDHLLRLINSI